MTCRYGDDTCCCDPYCQDVIDAMGGDATWDATHQEWKEQCSAALTEYDRLAGCVEEER